MPSVLPTKIAHILLYDTYGENDTRGKILTRWREMLDSPAAQNLAMSDGKQILDLTHIDDVVRGLGLMIDSMDALNANTIYSLESTNRISVRDLAGLFGSLSKRTLPIDFGASTSSPKPIQIPLSAENIDPTSQALQAYAQDSMINGGGGTSARNQQCLASLMPLSKLPNYTPQISLESGLMRLLSTPQNLKEHNASDHKNNHI